MERDPISQQKKKKKQDRAWYWVPVIPAGLKVTLSKLGASLGYVELYLQKETARLRSQAAVNLLVLGWRVSCPSVSLPACLHAERGLHY